MKVGSGTGTGRLSQWDLKIHFQLSTNVTESDDFRQCQKYKRYPWIVQYLVNNDIFLSQAFPAEPMITRYSSRLLWFHGILIRMRVSQSENPIMYCSIISVGICILINLYVCHTSECLPASASRRHVIQSTCQAQKCDWLPDHVNDLLQRKTELDFQSTGLIGHRTWRLVVRVVVVVKDTCYQTVFMRSSFHTYM